MCTERSVSFLPGKKCAYRDYRECLNQLNALDMDEEQRNREKAFLEFEINEIQEAALISGEDEKLEDKYRKLSNARKIMESVRNVHSLTGYDRGAADMTGTALKEFSRISDYDKELAPLMETLTEIDSLLSDFSRDLSSYIDSLTFDEETFFETEKRLDLINGLKAKYGQTIEEILSYQEEQQEKLEKLQKFEENFQELKEKFASSEEVLEKASHELSVIRKEYSKQLDEKIIEGLKELNFPSLYQMEEIPVMQVNRSRDNKPVHVNVDMEGLLEKVSAQNFVPVIDDEKVFIGIITRRDVIHYLAKQCRSRE